MPEQQEQQQPYRLYGVEVGVVEVGNVKQQQPYLLHGV